MGHAAYVGLVVSALVIAFLVGNAFVRSYRSRYGGLPTIDEQWARFAEDPGGFLRGWPRQAEQALTVLTTKSADPSVDRLRRLTEICYVAVFLAIFAGSRVPRLVHAIAADGDLLPPLLQAAQVAVLVLVGASWARFLVDPRTRRSSGLTVLSVVGLLATAVFMGIALIAFGP